MLSLGWQLREVSSYGKHWMETDTIDITEWQVSMDGQKLTDIT